MTSNEHETTPTPDPTARASRPRSRRGLTTGMAIGLLGGTAAGLVFGVPGLTSASSNDLAALVGQTDTTEVPTTDETDETPAPDAEADETPIPGRHDWGQRGVEHLRESLQDLVDDGTITAEQADAVAADLVEDSVARAEQWMAEHGDELREIGERFKHRPGGGVFGRGAGVTSEALTDLLGLEAQELREQLRDGATLAEIATAQGVEPQAVIDELVSEYQERLDNAVENGRLEQAEADERLAEATERITTMVNDGMPARPERPADEPSDTPSDDVAPDDTVD